MLTKYKNIESVRNAFSSGKLNMTNWSVPISSRLGKVFYHELFIPNNGVEMVEAVHAIPNSVRKKWITEHECFGSNLLNGVFSVQCSDPYVASYLLQYILFLHPFYLDELVDLFESVGIPSAEEAYEFRQLIELLYEIRVNLDKMHSVAKFVKGENPALSAYIYTGCDQI